MRNRFDGSFGNKRNISGFNSGGLYCFLTVGLEGSGR
jgi:hypothetical protein